MGRSGDTTRVYVRDPNFVQPKLPEPVVPFKDLNDADWARTHGHEPATETCQSKFKALRECAEANGDRMGVCTWYLKQWRTCESEERGDVHGSYRDDDKNASRFEAKRTFRPELLRDDDWARNHGLDSAHKACETQFREMRKCATAHNDSLALCREYLAIWESCQYGDNNSVFKAFDDSNAQSPRE